MAKETMGTKFRVPLIGFKEDYINLPIIKDGVAIGVITNCEEKRFQFELTATIWQEISVELTNNVPSAVWVK